jgi:hypothetical protein
VDNLLVIPVILLSREPGVCIYGLRPLTSWRFAHTRLTSQGSPCTGQMLCHSGNAFEPESSFFYTLYLWPAATNVVALRPHQTKRKPTAVPSWNSQPPRNIFAIYKTRAAKSRHGVRFNFDLHLQTASALFENTNASDRPSMANES